MVNLRAAERQALGKHFIATTDEVRRVKELRQRRLIMAPHKPWTLPEQPTWTENPFNDNNWQFQYHMLRWLDPLRRAGEAGDIAAAEQWAHYARSWIQTNPPGASESSWAWVDMADGIRAMELCHGLCAVGEQDWLVRSLEQHRDWLIDPAHIKHGNHGLHQTVGLFVVCAVLEDSAGMDTAVSWLGERLLQSWDQQGVNEEGSLAYHRMNYVWWQETLVRLDLEGVSRPEGAERLTLAPEEMAHATSPLGKLARIGDTNDASISDIDHPFAKYVTSDGRRGTAPAQNVAIYDSGYAYVRSGWGQHRPFSEETLLTAMFGPQDKVHGHRDGGSITYCSQGVQWLHDQGRFYYGKDPMQRYVVSRGAHSLVVLPGRTARSSAVVELVHQDVTDDYVDLLISDPSYEGVEITRRIVYLKHWDLTVVLDRVKADELVQAEQRWHCGRGVKATPLSIGFVLGSGEQNLHIGALVSGQKRDVRSGQKEPMLGWTATGWRKSAPVDVGTVYDDGSDISFGALLGTWTPAAMDLLQDRLGRSVDVSANLTSLIPAALLSQPWEAAGTAPTSAKSEQLSATVDVTGADVIRVRASSRDRYFAFDLYEEGQPVVRTSWTTRAEHTFDVAGLSNPRLQVRSRTSPTDGQRLSLGPEAWGSPYRELVQRGDDDEVRPEHGIVLGEDQTPRTLILLETMFCDNENDPEVLSEYFSRFQLCLRSLAALEIPVGTEVVVTAYISSDKVDYLQAVDSLLSGLHDGQDHRLRIRVVEYDHPADGYPVSDRIDWQKSPNKHAPYRDQLFQRAHDSFDLTVYDRLIRMAIDDDDLMLRTHVTTMVDLASRVLDDASDTDVVVMGPLRSYVAYVGEDDVQVVDVEMRRSLTGNKAFVVRNPTMDKVADLSPWSVPELMTAVQKSTVESRGQELRPVHDNRPGFVYMRWGQNLSSHRKDFHITRTNSAVALSEPADLLTLEAPAGAAEVSFEIVPLDLRVSARRNGDAITVSSNFDKLRAGNGHVCFQVFHGGKRIASTPYSRRGAARFDEVPAGSVVRGYVRVNGEIAGRCQTGAV